MSHVSHVKAVKAFSMFLPFCLRRALGLRKVLQMSKAVQYQLVTMLQQDEVGSKTHMGFLVCTLLSVTSGSCCSADISAGSPLALRLR